MQRPQTRTLLKMLIVACILTLFWPAVIPTVFGTREAALATADKCNLMWHGQVLELYKLQNRRKLPNVGGHEFVLSTWSIVDKTEENFDRYFTPGRRDDDPDYRALRAKVERGEKIWGDLASTTSRDTHYAGRAKEHPLSAASGKDEAMMADDNEGVWSLANGTVHVLFCGGDVRSYTFLDMKSRSWVQGEPDKNKPLATWGPNSPIPECRKLDR